jgi:hypothetical protein
MVCTRALSCECSQLNEVETQSDCELAATPLYEAEREAALLGGATFDLDCAEDTLERMRNSTCDQLTTGSLCKVCKPYVGTKLWGDQCDSDWECEGRLRCMLFDFSPVPVCVDPCEAEQPFLVEGDGCFEDAPCDGDLWCDQRTSTCQVLPAVGAECPFGRCEEDGYCDLDTGMCVAHDSSAECTYVGQCGPDMVCSSSDVTAPGTCGALPAADQPCGPWGECEVGLNCEDDTCRVPEKFICDELERVG